MKFYLGTMIEKIGYDFYCDVAINVVNKRKALNMTQEELSKKSGIKLARLRKIENVKIRTTLDDIEALAKVLDVTVNNLMNTTLESQVGECLYLVYPEELEELKLYSRADNKRMAFLKLEKRLNERGVTLLENSRSRVFVKLVGQPVTKQELQDKLPKFKEEQELEK